MKISLLTVLLLLSGLNLADQKDPRLGDLFLQLKQAPDVAAAVQVEQEIWQVWLAHDNRQYTDLMARGIQQMNRNDLSAALQTFNQLVQVAPEYAEGWNKRATLHYLLGNYRLSEQDIAKTLELEPFHFGALSGRGLVNLALEDYVEARRAFYAALEVYPNMESVKNNLRALDDFLRQNTI